MKRMILIALALLLLAGCGGKEAAVSPALHVDGTPFTHESAVDEILTALGEDFTYYEAISCVYDGMDKTYDYGDVTVYTYPDGDTDQLMELYCTGGDVSAQGITIGSTKDEVVKTFGTGYTEEGSVLSYSLKATEAQNAPASLYFELEDETVTAIAITAEHREE